MSKPVKTVKSLLIQLKQIGDETIVGDLKGVDKLTYEQESCLRRVIASIQNELGEIDKNIFDKFDVEHYKNNA